MNYCGSGDSSSCSKVRMLICAHRALVVEIYGPILILQTIFTIIMLQQSTTIKLLLGEGIWRRDAIREE